MVALTVFKFRIAPLVEPTFLTDEPPQLFGTILTFLVERLDFLVCLLN
jgi:hypothetical protein